ncbi:hypothetical protein [Mucilaginibacter ginsenosidivorans]|uniref:Uncharacterized protein n=1 Tax=Mucilaginibacter ginsenosidivorans TaxID=398053 RepID=A0A5B8UUU7_9SPHI|nr:hypothetical protein [Mucilaginibacter ginsenosidivorans]QEC62692.1 hypothetical protein FRZ54_08865 [Mucilaginibacter ginsenosidivorans]
MKHSHFLYSLKIWLSSAVIAPVLFFVSQLFTNPRQCDLSEIGIYPFLLVIELIFSFVTWLVFWAFIETVAWATKDNLLRKCLISFIGIALTIGTFSVFSMIESYSLLDFPFVMMLANALLIALGTWYFNVEPKINSETLPDSTLSINSNEN